MVERLVGVVGPMHPYTLQCSVTSANAYFAVGEPAAALEIERRVYEQMAQTLGETHPDRLVAGCNLAASRQALGDTAGLAEHRAELVALATRALGRDHPITTAVQSGERWDCEVDLSAF